MNHLLPALTRFAKLAGGACITFQHEGYLYTSIGHAIARVAGADADDNTIPTQGDRAKDSVLKAWVSNTVPVPVYANIGLPDFQTAVNTAVDVAKAIAILQAAPVYPCAELRRTAHHLGFAFTQAPYCERVGLSMLMRAEFTFDGGYKDTPQHRLVNVRTLKAWADLLPKKPRYGEGVVTLALHMEEGKPAHWAGPGAELVLAEGRE